MLHRARSVLLAAAVLAAACGGDAGTEVGGGAASTAPSPSASAAPEPEAAACADPVALAAPDGFTRGEPQRASDASAAYAQFMQEIGSDDTSVDAAAADAAGLTSTTTLTMTRPAAGDRQDQVALTVSTFADEAGAASEFSRLRDRAEREVPEFTAGGADFGVPAGAMVQIDPNTGQTVGPTPRAELIVMQACARIVQAYVLFADEDTYDPSVSTRIVVDVTSNA